MTASNLPNPIEIERYLKGASYPMSKQDLIKHAKQNEAPEDMMQLLNKLADKHYQSPVDVSKEVGRKE